MDRNEFIKLCQRCAVGEAEAAVRCQYGEYKAHGYYLTFDESGRPRHTAVLMDKNKRSLLYIELGKVEMA